MSVHDDAATSQNGTCACCHPGPDRPGRSRRHVLQAALTGAAATLVAGAGFGLGQAALAESKPTPAGALQALVDGNARFVAGRLQSFNEDLAILKQNTASKQEPFAAVLSCADSRVPVELVFDQSIGHLFVARVAGNVVTPEITASLEYGTIVLGARAIVVLGHSSCGAIKAAIEGKEVPGQISALYTPLRPAIDQAGHDADAAVKVNAKIQARLLREASPVIAGLIAGGKLTVVAAYYDLASGKVTLLS